VLKTILTCNIHGLNPYKFKEKKNLLEDIARENNTFLISLTETHLNPNIKDAEIHIENFVPLRTDRTGGRKGGGIVVYIRENLAPVTTTILSQSNGTVEFSMLHIQSLNIIVISVYRPPDCSYHHFAEAMDLIKSKLTELDASAPNLVMVGDFNFPNINWHTQNVYGGSLEMRNQAENLFNLADNHCMEQYIEQPTRGNNILDLLFLDNEEFLHHYTVQETILSDHNLIIIHTNLTEEEKITESCEEVTSHPDQVSFRQLNFFNEKIDWNKIQEDLNEMDWTAMTDGLQAQEIYRIFVNETLQVCIKHVPLRKLPPKQKRIPQDRRILMRKITKLSKKVHHSRNEHNKKAMTSKILLLEEQLKDSHREEHQREEEAAVGAIKTNPKYFYKYAKSKATVKATIGPFITQDGVIVHNAVEKSNILRKQYESVFSVPKQTLDNYQAVQDIEALTDINFNNESLENAIKELNSTSSAGPDGFPAILLKKCSSILCTPLLILWRASLDEGRVPNSLKQAIIAPIYKGGDRGSPSNYRPIALTSHIVKVFEKVIAKSINRFLVDTNQTNDGQHGFRSGRSCLSQLLEHHDLIIKYLEKGSEVDVVYLDFAKAFDKVDHKILLTKLERYGIWGKLLTWIRSFLTERTQIVSVEGSFSGESRVVSGVPQGSVLGPLLFLIHLTDIDSNITSSTVSSFADDTRVLMEIKDPNDSNELQSDLDKLYAWATENNMFFNGCKFEVLHYSNTAVPEITRRYTSHDGKQIESKINLRDLGVKMNNTGDFSDHLIEIASKARKQMGWVLRTFKTRDTLPMLTLFRSLVVPLLEYCCQLWNPHKVGEIQRLEAVQRTFTSKITDVKHLNYWQRLKALKLYSLQRRRERYTILYVWKIIRGLVPNFRDPQTGGILVTDTGRRGKLCKILPLNSRSLARVQSLRENSFAVMGPRLFNCLPFELREANETSLESFKTKLDEFLLTVKDQPPLPHYYQAAPGNSLVHQIHQMHVQNM
jgi:exonuclease III